MNTGSDIISHIIINTVDSLYINRLLERFHVLIYGHHTTNCATPHTHMLIKTTTIQYHLNQT